MSEFNEKFKEYEIKNKKKSRTGVALLVVGLIVFAGLFIYNIYTKQEKEEEVTAIIEETSAYSDIEKVAQKINDSIQYLEKKRLKDSVNQIVQEVQTKINRLNHTAGIGDNIKLKIDSIQVKLNTIESISDRIVVRYYKRKADGNQVERVIKSFNSPNFYLNYRDVPNDDGSRKVNALYYGKNVDQKHVQLLYRRLKENDKDFQYLKPFISAKGFEWKEDAIEIGFEKPTSTTDENAKFYIRVYGYGTDAKIKHAIGDKLEAKGFQVKLYPDWEKKQSFFSNQSTVLYYDSSNKEKAISIAKTLTDLVKKISYSRRIVKDFDVKRGSGLGVDKDERKELFIIHYNGKY